MTQKINARHLILVGLFLLLVGTPAAILAADAGSGTATLVHLPIIHKPPSFTSTGTLGNGGTFEGPDGVGIGALTDTLTAPIEVTIAVTSPPTVTLPAAANSMGGYYQIGAAESVFALTETPFILAFPIPPGADSAHLALAMVQSGEEVLDGADGTQSWALLEGVVDPDQGLFLTTIAGLKEGGSTFTPVEHPDFDSPPNNGPNYGSLRNGNGSQQFDLFTVHCVNFSDPAQCSDVTESEVAGYLADIYARIHVDLGFNLPRLRYMDETLAYTPNSFNAQGYTAYIEPKNQGACKPGTDGYYTPAEGRLVLCLDPAVGLNTNSVKTLIHEYFHATQYGYLEVFADYMDQSREKWVIEGMAASAEESYFGDEMQRSDAWPNLHLADVTLKSNHQTEEYQAQDFWVYYGQLAGQDLTYLAWVLEEGATAQSVVDALDSSGEVLGVYWLWVKNHLMEPAIDYDGLLGTACQLEEQVVGYLEHMNVGGYSDPFADFLVDPLGSVVVELHFDWDGYTAADGRVFPVPDPNLDPIAAQALQYKFYKEGEADCSAVPDKWRTFFFPVPTERYFVVISNTDPENSHDYRVSFEYGPTPP